MGMSSQGGQRTPAAYLATCKYDWQTSDERDGNVGMIETLQHEVGTIATIRQEDQQYTISHLHIYLPSRSLTCYVSLIRHHIPAYPFLTLETNTRKKLSNVSTEEEEEQGGSGSLGQRDADDPTRYTISTPVHTLASKLRQLPQIRRHLTSPLNEVIHPGRTRQRHAPLMRHPHPSTSRPLTHSSTVT